LDWRKGFVDRLVQRGVHIDICRGFGFQRSYGLALRLHGSWRKAL
jgi:hypothetical protein